MSFHDHEPEEYNLRFGVKKRQDDEAKKKLVDAIIGTQGATDPLPNGINLLQLKELLAYSDKYEISIQFWPEQTAVFIAKDGVDLKDYGGSFPFSVGKAIEYLNRITGKTKQ